MRCAFCGGDTTESVDYLVLQVTSPYSTGEQFFGAHAHCLNSSLHDGFETEVHLM